MKSKYIVADVGHELVIVFNEALQHSDFLRLGYKIVSAGFIHVKDGQFQCYGNSTSLNKKSRPSDSELANFQLAAITG